MPQEVLQQAAAVINSFHDSNGQKACDFARLVME